MKYEAIIGGTQNIESSLHKNLIEHLNAEIVLNTITDVSIALEWLKSTFLYIRILKNPTYYGIPEGLDMDILETKLQEMCVESLNTLRDHGLINMDEGFDLKPTDTGKLMARYCLAFESIKLFLGLQGNEDLNDLVNVVCQCKEFIDLKLRNNEKKVLNTLNKDKNRVTIRFPINGKTKTTEQKISCLLQATLGCLPINEFSLNQDVTKIFRSGQRVSKCLYEFCMLQNNYNLLMNALQLSKCFRSRIWENSKYVSKQLEKVGLSLSTMLVNAGLTTFQKIEETNPREIELIVNRHPPFGNQVKEAVASLPKYEVDIEQKSNYGVSKAELVISVTMVNYIKRQDSGKSTGFHYCILLVADADDQIVHKQRLSDAVFFAIGTWSKKIEVKRAYSSSELTINVISQDLVGLDLQKTFTPYYNGPHIDYYKRPTSLRRKNIPVKVAPEETERRKRPEKAEKRQPCNHRCINKHLCAHECCKIGVIAKKIEPKWSDINQNTKTPRNENTSRSRESKLNTFVDQLHARNQLIPATPGRKRLLGHSTGTDFEFSRSGTGRSILSQYEYKRKAKISRVNVTGTEDIEDFEDDDWQEMDFYEDTMKTGNPDKIDLTGEIWDQDFDNEDDDWYLEFGFLDDKPKQSKIDESTEPPLPDTNVHLYYQKKYQNSTISNQGQLKSNTTDSYPGNQTQVRPTTSDESMTNAKCNSFPRPDSTQCKPSSLLSDNQNKRTLANQASTITKLPPKASLYKSNLWQSSISCNNNRGPSKNIRLSNSPKYKSNFSWSTNPGSPNESLTKPLSCKISLHGDFLTAADVAEARRKRQNEMSYLGRSVYMNDFSSNGLGMNQPSFLYSGTQKASYGQEQEGAVQTRLQESLPRSQYFSSNAYFGGNKINTHITSKPSNTLSTDQDMISPQTQRLYDGEQHMHQSSPEWEMGPEYGTLPSSDTQKSMTEAQKLARVEDTAKTKSFHKSVPVSVLPERSNNAKSDREWGISRGETANTNTCGKQVTNSVGSISFNSSQCYLNAFSGLSDDEEENQDAFKNIFTDVF